MKKSFAFTMLVFLMFSCSEENPIQEVPPTMPLCSLEVYVYHCENVLCDTEQPLEDFLIELYPTLNDALAGTAEIRSEITDADGIIRFANMDCNMLYVKVVTEKYGTYINHQSMAENAVISFHDVRFVAGFSYANNGVNRVNQRHISLSEPVVGQESTYKYHHNQFVMSYEPEYTDVELHVKIIDQLNANRYVIQETIDSLFGVLKYNPGYPGTEVVVSEWLFEEDSLHVVPHEDEYFASFVWNLGSGWYENEQDGYSFSLTRPTNFGLDMNTEEAYNITSAPPSGYVEDYTLLGHEFDELILERISYMGVDGPAKTRIYSKKDGLVRSLDFFTGGSSLAHGFDLILE